MAYNSNRALCVVLTTVFLVSVRRCHARLVLTMDLKEDTNFCGHLNCWNTGTSDKVIFAVTSISLYDISQPAVRIQLATVKNDGAGIKINQSKTSEVVGAGCINRYDADLSVNLMKQQDCQSGSFLCELEYIDTDGHSDTLIAHSTSVNASGKCDCSAATSQQSILARELNAMRQNYTFELAALKEENIKLSTQFQDISEELALIKNLASIPADQTSHSITTEDRFDLTKQASSTFECIKGVTQNNIRVRFLLWGQTPAVCDTQTDGGGWIVIQRRVKGDVDFYKNWQMYKTGFGILDSDFWLGNEAIHKLTSRGYNELRIDMIYNNTQYYAQYDVFSVDNEQQNYRLTVSGYRGTAGDSLAYHNYVMFSTYDRNNDRSSESCAVKQQAAWWYYDCYFAHLNGVWGRNNVNGIIWKGLDSYTSLTFTEVKVRKGHV